MLSKKPIKDIPKPEGSLWTDEQWQAISAKGKHILVAAAAGSGKTAVLVERMIRRITDPHEPVDVDRLLVVTFTNAAAAEMKKRIGDALEKELSQQPHSLYLKRQLSLLNQASISTLHSFCLDVLRAYYFQLDLDPKFRIAEETELVLIKEEVLEELFEERYSREDDATFFQLVDCFSSDRSDQELQGLVLQLYEFSRSHPFPQEWLTEMLDFTSSAKLQALSANLLALLRKEIKGFIEQLEHGSVLAGLPNGPTAYASNLIEDINMLRQVATECEQSWDQAYDAFQTASFGRLKSSKGDDIDPQLQLRVKEIRDRIKKEFGQIKEQYFQRTLDEHKADLERMTLLMKTLVELVLQFTERFSVAKRKKALMDYSDLEHGCLAILRESSSSLHEWIPSDVARRYQQKFVEILVDEYQDTNLVQESILYLICSDTEEQGNLFMVGDVKQSIYRFRMADPSIFLNKYKAFESITLGLSSAPSQRAEAMVDSGSDMAKDKRVTENQAIENQVTEYQVTENQQTDQINVANNEEPTTSVAPGWRIDLARNFRSRAQVLDGTNYIFKQVMNEQVGEIDYDSAAELKLGASYPEESMPIELTIIDRGSQVIEDEDEFSVDHPDEEGVEGDIQALDGGEPQSLSVVSEVELETVQLEARFMAQRIKQLVSARPEESFQVYDPKLRIYRPIRYQDIVILLRATSVWAPTILEEFKQQGIPAYAELTTGYFEATEVAIMLSLLKIIDNPFQDIPLASVLRSPIVGLSGEELALIRVAIKKGSFYEAICAFILEGDAEQITPKTELSEKLKRFLGQLESWRNRARKGSLAELIWQLYRETGYYDFVGGTAGGNQRQANLRALYDRARQYEATSFRGLFRFLRFVERMQDRGSDLGTARALTEQEDVVRIMTIHKSKGLEFPVVFVAGLGKMFNQSDLRQKLLLHKELGIGTKVIDVERRISYPTLQFQLMKHTIQQELLAEEMRVLYVALTRAKEKLILVGTLRDARKKLNQWAQVQTVREWTLPDSLRSQAKNYLDWLGPAVIRHQAGKGLLEDVELEANPLYSLNIAEESMDEGKELGSGHEVEKDPSSWSIAVIPSIDLVSQELGVKNAQDGRLQAIAAQEPIELASNLSQAEEVARRLEWQYSYPMSRSKLAKQSVTELKRQYQWLLQEEEQFPLVMHHQSGTSETGVGGPALRGRQSHLGQPSKPERPRFMQTEARSLTATERGTALHTVMQHLPLGKDLSAKDVKEQLEVMVIQEKLTRDEAASINIELILQFCQSQLNSWFMKAEELYREVPFTFSLSAQEIFADWQQDQDERVILQGVMDVLCKVDGHWIMVDYKTDAITNRFRDGFEEAQPILLERYRLQIELYTRAIEELWKVPVHRKFLYFFDGGYTLEVT